MKHLRHLAFSLFMKIAEPRAIRIMLFFLYICMLIAGLGVLAHPSSKFEGVLGLTLVYIFGSFIFLGAFLCVIAVLPGIWWLERVGILALITGMSIYTIAIITLGATLIGTIVSISFALTFAIRWQEIKRFQLAPLEPKER